MGVGGGGGEGIGGGGGSDGEEHLTFQPGISEITLPSLFLLHLDTSITVKRVKFAIRE